MTMGNFNVDFFAHESKTKQRIAVDQPGTPSHGGNSLVGDAPRFIHEISYPNLKRSISGLKTCLEPPSFTTEIGRFVSAISIPLVNDGTAKSLLDVLV